MGLCSFGALILLNYDNSFSKRKAPSTKTINDYISLHIIRDSNDFITQGLYCHCYYQWHFCCRNLEIRILTGDH